MNGRIVAAGTPKGPVRFSALADKKPASWGEMQLEHADGSIFKNCLVEYGTWGVHSHFSRLEISDSTFRHNTGGMRFRSGPVTIARNLFTDNEIGIRSFRGNALIEGNSITANRVGLFVREKGSGLKVRRNDFSKNSDYNIRNGDFNDEDVDARENWWGSATPVDTILDARREPGIGVVHFEPVLPEPVHAAVKEQP